MRTPTQGYDSPLYVKTGWPLDLETGKPGNVMKFRRT